MISATNEDTIFPECRTDNDTHRQIHHVPAHRKFAKFFNNAHVILPMKPTIISLTNVKLFSCQEWI